MKISELIEMLEGVRVISGDIEVHVLDTELGTTPLSFWRVLARGDYLDSVGYDNDIYTADEWRQQLVILD